MYNSESLMSPTPNTNTKHQTGASAGCQYPGWFAPNMEMKMAAAAKEREGMPSPKQCGEKDACIDRTAQNSVPEKDEIIPVSPVKVDGDDELQLSLKSQDLLIISSLTFLCFSLLAWVLFRHKKHQKEWQQASNLQLKQISQRNFMQTNSQPKEEKKRTTKAEATPINAASKSSTNSRKEMDTDRVRSIRAKQQEQNEVKAKLAKQQKRLAKEEKKRQIFESLQHEDADRAYERRTKQIREEQSMPQATTQERSSSNNEAEETERRELLRMQNLEYEESLRQDQERLIQATIELERSQMRARTLQDAIHRLERAGIHTADLPIIDHNTAVEIRDEDKIQVRLMLPSGKRVHATYSKHHCIGLVYDLVLVILNYNQQEVEDRDADANVSTTKEETRNQSERRCHAEWKELFDPFTINTAFPPQCYEEIDLSLEQCGLQQSVMFMVVVESDLN